MIEKFLAILSEFAQSYPVLVVADVAIIVALTTYMVIS